MAENAHRPGCFVVVEGIDGSGTTTLVAGLARQLTSLGHQVVETREPTSRPIGALLRSILGGHSPVTPDWATMALLFAADRRDHVVDCVLPAMAASQVVLSDRYDLSSLAYQSATSERGGVTDWIRLLNREAVRPTLTLVVDVSADCAAKRRSQRSESREIYEVEALQRRLAELYSRAEELVPGDRLVHLDGEAPPEVVLQEALRQVLPLLG